MKSVLVSIQPKWCEKIANKQKTIEVIKSRPKEVPFKCYIYCTKPSVKGRYCVGAMVFNSDELYRTPDGKIKYGDSVELMASDSESYSKDNFLHGKVIGEFVCDKIDEFYCATVPYRKENNLGYGRFIDNGVYKVKGLNFVDSDAIVFERRKDKRIDTMLKNDDLEKMCLTSQQLFDYVGLAKYFYSWHISALKIYDEPIDFEDFTGNFTSATECNAEYRNDEWFMDCWCCQNSENEECPFMHYPKCSGENDDYEDYAYCMGKGKKPIKRPPQGWMYVEELK